MPRYLAAIFGGIVLAGQISAPVSANEAPADLRGAWSGEPRCAAAAMRHVFGATTYEWRTAAKRLYYGEARYQIEGDKVVVTLTKDLDTPEKEQGGPQAGDVITYQRAGATLRPLSLTRGKATNQYPPTAPLFRRCQSS